MGWNPKKSFEEIAPKITLPPPKPSQVLKDVKKAVTKSTAPARKAVAKATPPKPKAVLKKAVSSAKATGGKIATGGKSTIQSNIVQPTKDLKNLVTKPSAKNLQTLVKNGATGPTNTLGKIVTGRDNIVDQKANPIKKASTSLAKSNTLNPAAAPKPAASPKPTTPKPGAPTGVPGSNPNDLNHWGINRPTRFETLNPDGTAKSQYQVDYKNERAMSPWAKMMQKNETDRFNASKSDVLSGAMAGATSGMNSMARQGGLTGGARVALMNQANQGAIGAQQNLANQYQGRMSGIATDDITRQQTIDERNANTSLGQVDKDFGAKFDVYSEMLKKNSSDYMADAIARGGEAGNAAEAQQAQDVRDGKTRPDNYLGKVQDWSDKMPGHKYTKNLDPLDNTGWAGKTINRWGGGKVYG
jgi:hypothetical protein